MLKKYIQILMQKNNLTTEQTQKAVEIFLRNENPIQTAVFLTLLHAKQETAEELLGIIQVLQEQMITVPLNQPVLDIVGTGGDGMNTINISTGAAIVAASCGVKIVKHGGRAVSSRCGSADVLEALGINIHQSVNQVKKLVSEVGMAFCFAPDFHPALKTLALLRKQLNLPTALNLVGPLLNPARAHYFLCGVKDERLMEIMAVVMHKLCVNRALIVHSEGVDEVTTAAPVLVTEVTQKEKKSYVLEGKDFGFAACTLKDLQGEDAKTNAKLLLNVFNGKSGPIADTIIFNAALALYIYSKADSIEHAVSIVKNTIAAGETAKFLQKFIEVSHE